MRRWKYLGDKNDFELLKQLKKETGLDDLSLKILINRGIKTLHEIDIFYNGKIENLGNPKKMKDAEEAAQIIIDSIKANEEIVVLGDYDDDGALAIVVAIKALRKLGANVSYYTNNRFTQGYGMQISSIDEILKNKPNTKLIITVDNGIMAFDGANYAVKEKNLKLIITDHHEQGDSLPVAHAIVNPKRKDEDFYSYNRYLCGAGVIWKLMLLVYWNMKEDLKYLYDMTDIVAMATVGDIVPLLGENRIIVKDGLSKIKNGDNLTFKILQEVTGVKEINAHYTLGFVYVPMVNAVGRINGSVEIAVEMFLSEDEETITKYALQLKELNEKRKELTVSQEELCKTLIPAESEVTSIIVSHGTFHEGIVGLIAGRLKETFNRPSIVLKNEDGVLKGSARSIPGFHIKEALDKCSDLLLGYGGHDMAAGLSLKETNLEAFKNRINRLIKETFGEAPIVKTYNVDYVVTPEKLTIEMIENLKELEPYGANFEKPLIALDGFNVEKVYFMGEEKQHLKLVGNKNLTLLAWREADKYLERKEPKKIKALGYPELNIWNNNVNIQFVIDSDNFIPQN